MMFINYFTTQLFDNINVGPCLDTIKSLFCTWRNRILTWIKGPYGNIQMIDTLMKEMLQNPAFEIQNGYGEFIAYRQDSKGHNIPLSRVEHQKAYAIFNRFTADQINSNAYENRHLQILENVKAEISSDCKIAFVPRVLCELILMRKCLEEEALHKGCGVFTVNEMLLRNKTSVKLTENEIIFAISGPVSKSAIKKATKANKCWHRCYFDDAGSNQHPDVEKIAYKLHKEILKNDLFKDFKGNLTYQHLIDYTKDELKKIHSYNYIIQSESDDQLVLKCLAVECSQIAKKSILLYRGANFSLDNCKSNYSDTPYSLSYGTGLFAGYLYERGVTGAMAFNYMIRKINDAYITFLPVDNIQSSLIYVPPTNTYCQFAGFGEIFHTRSKGWKGYDIQKMKGFQQGEDRRDHLISPLTQSDFMRQFEQFKHQTLLLNKANWSSLN